MSRNLKQQQRANAALEKRKAIRRLEKQTSSTYQPSDAVDVPSSSVITSDMLHESMLTSAVDRIASALERKFVPIPRPLAIEAQNSSSPWAYLPYVPLKRMVHWLAPKQQDRNSHVSLTEEILAFANYVSVLDHCFLILNFVISMNCCCFCFYCLMFLANH